MQISVEFLTSYICDDEGSEVRLMEVEIWKEGQYFIIFLDDTI